MPYYSDRIQRLCFECKQINKHDSCFCPKCKSNANVPIGYETINPQKYKRCKNCGRLNQLRRYSCSYCGSYPLYSLKKAPELSCAEIVYSEGIKKFINGDYEAAFNDFKVSAYDHRLEWALLALAECYRYGYGVEADTEKGITCLKKCHSAEALEKIELFRKKRKNPATKDAAVSASSKSRIKQNKECTPKKKEKRPIQESIACSQVVKNHPLLKESPVMRRAYLCALRSIDNKIDSNSRYTHAVLKLYEKTLDAYGYRSACNFQLPSKIKNLLLFDVLVLIGYDQKKLDAKCIKVILDYLGGGTRQKKTAPPKKPSSSTSAGNSSAVPATVLPRNSFWRYSRSSGATAALPCVPHRISTIFYPWMRANTERASSMCARPRSC